jgi:hypothetical protein
VPEETCRYLGGARSERSMVADLAPTRRLLLWRPVGPLMEALHEVATEFPELSGMRIRVDRLPPFSARLGTASIFERPPRLAFHPGLVRDPDALRATAAHEFTHLLQWPLRTVPGGERACDLYALARCGSRFPGPPGYLRLPPRTREKWGRWAPVAQELARAALEERGRGRRQYLRWWEERFRTRTQWEIGGSTGPEGVPGDSGGSIPEERD